MANPMTVAMHAAHIASVWSSCQKRQDAYTAKDLEKLLHLPMRAAASALLLLAWTRRREFSKRTGRRRLTTRWYPPGVSPPPIPRGRPRIDLLAILLS